MSLDRPSDVPSPTAEPPAAELGLALLLRSRGAPLVEALERHLPGAREHADAAAAYAFAAAVELGFERPQCEVAREAAMLHEIGLVYVPGELLGRPAGERDEAEIEAFERHFEAGYGLACGAGIPKHASEWLLRARERYDGGGPDGIAAEAIPIESRIIRAACSCDTALARAEDAGHAAPARLATEELARGAGRELDPRVVAALTAVLAQATRT